METSLGALISPCFLLLLCAYHPLARAADTVSRDRRLSGSQRLVSSGGNFALGFFQSDGNAPDRWYLAIWYNKIPKKTPVWIANRATPISDPNSSQLTISEDGNLVLLDQLNSLIWTTNITSNISKSAVGVILDSGNFVLAPASNTSNFHWQSFDEPTNVWLPGAKLGRNKITGQTSRFTSWRSSVDPSPGYYTLEIDPNGGNQFIHLWNNSAIYWETGSWIGNMFVGVPEMALYPKESVSYEFVVNDQETYFMYRTNASTTTAMFIMEISGQVKTVVWIQSKQDWTPFLALPKAKCSVYLVCGSFSMCTENAVVFCSCLRGFSKQYEGDWRYGDPNGGCTRNAKLHCGGNSSRKAEADGFYALAVAKLPDTVRGLANVSTVGCKEACLNNCSCAAYSYAGGGCSLWYGDLINIVVPADGSTELTIYIRLATSEFSGSAKTRKSVVIGTSAAGAILVTLIVVVGILLIQRKRRFSEANKMEGPLVVFKYKYLQYVTKNFSERLGRGSFGSVYKGALPDGTLIAVKKLEGVSQGDKQFRAEVSTIGTIQHVNLIRLLGFCSERSTKMLVYEFMPNGSLDRYLSGRTPVTLGWKTKYKIALGVAKGLAYLHEECRSHIIHCDVKPENVLLDSAFTARVADFGLAKLVGRDFSRVLTTMRGTIGYLAPEWISGTAVTAKVDVFSYGMMLFEIISGSRSVHWQRQRQRQGADTFFPVQVAMKLPEGNVQDLVGPEIAADANLEEVERACKVACWCVQDDESTRPTMGDVVQVLEGSVDISFPPVPWYLHLLAQRSDFSTEEASH